MSQNTLPLDQSVSVVAACANSCLFVPILTVVRNRSANSILILVRSIRTSTAITILVFLHTEWIVVYNIFAFLLTRNALSVN